MRQNFLVAQQSGWKKKNKTTRNRVYLLANLYFLDMFASGGNLAEWLKICNPKETFNETIAKKSVSF